MTVTVGQFSCPVIGIGLSTLWCSLDSFKYCHALHYLFPLIWLSWFFKKGKTLMEPVWAEDVIQATAAVYTVMNCGQGPEKSAPHRGSPKKQEAETPHLGEAK